MSYKGSKPTTDWRDAAEATEQSPYPEQASEGLQVKEVKVKNPPKGHRVSIGETGDRFYRLLQVLASKGQEEGAEVTITIRSKTFNTESIAYVEGATVETSGSLVIRDKFTIRDYHEN